MKIIDLLNKIANGEEVPKKIRITDIDDRITRHYNFFYDEDDQEYKDDELFPLGARLILDRVLNKKVEILDNKKVEILDDEEKGLPEKIKIHEKSITVKGTTFFRDKDIEIFQKLSMQINEIIDYLENQRKVGMRMNDYNRNDEQ